MMNKILEYYCPVADMIAGMFGSRCEAVVHDLMQPENSVVYVANGSVTGRKVGQAFDQLIRQVLLNQKFTDDKMVNYHFDTVDGKKIKSSSLLIRGDNEKVIGMLCVNFDITGLEIIQEQLSNFVSGESFQDDREDILVSQNVMTIIEELIQNVINNQDVKNFTRRKCVEIVKFMDEKGIFLVKGASERVSELMGISKVTLYSYLDEARGKRRNV